MSRSFQNGAFSANSTFGKTDRSSTSGDHIINLKSRALFRTSYANKCEKVVRCSNKNDCTEEINPNCRFHCEEDICMKKEVVPSNKTDSNSYSYLMNLRRGYNLDKNEIDNAPPFNQMDLVSGLYTALDLCNVTTLCAGVDVCVDNVGINPNCTPLYQYYRIDADGQLFGNTPCGINNYLNYVVLDK